MECTALKDRIADLEDALVDIGASVQVLISGINEQIHRHPQMSHIGKKGILKHLYPLLDKIDGYSESGQNVSSAPDSGEENGETDQKSKDDIPDRTDDFLYTLLHSKCIEDYKKAIEEIRQLQFDNARLSEIVIAKCDHADTKRFHWDRHGG